MEKKLTTGKRECPECGSSDIVYMGAAHVNGVGEPMKEVNQFQYKCKICNTEFWYQGKKRADS